jgi:hypothetical protein
MKKYQPLARDLLKNKNVKGEKVAVFNCHNYIVGFLQHHQNQYQDSTNHQWSYIHLCIFSQFDFWQVREQVEDGVANVADCLKLFQVVVAEFVLVWNCFPI